VATITRYLVKSFLTTDNNLSVTGHYANFVFTPFYLKNRKEENARKTSGHMRNPAFGKHFRSFRMQR